jgi:abortive infection bacteriophage resistance protein
VKSTKSYLYGMQKENLEFQLMNPVLKQYTEEYQKRINTYAEKIKKYSTEKEKK